MGGKGIFVDKKQILYKLEPSASKPSASKKKKKDKSESSGTTTKKGLPRKTGPKDAKKSSKKGGWKPPSWTKDVLEDDGGFFDYRPAHRGTTGKAKYDKAGYLPHAKWRKKKYKPEEYAAVQQEIDDETARIEAERQRIQWEHDELAKKQKQMDDKEREEADRRRIALEEEAERLRKLEEERKRKQALI